jgi:catechol 2,3-dioxygenase-like lactoylglutathione lyase family enzyme
MLDHVSLGVKDLERSRRFYDAALHPLGLVRTVDFQGRGSDYGAMAGQFGVEFTITVETLWASPKIRRATAPTGLSERCRQS